jgi:hypothetical protein
VGVEGWLKTIVEAWGLPGCSANTEKPDIPKSIALNPIRAAQIDKTNPTLRFIAAPSLSFAGLDQTALDYSQTRIKGSSGATSNVSICGYEYYGIKKLPLQYKKLPKTVNFSCGRDLKAFAAN